MLCPRRIASNLFPHNRDTTGRVDMEPVASTQDNPRLRSVLRVSCLLILALAFAAAAGTFWWWWFRPVSLVDPNSVRNQQDYVISMPRRLKCVNYESFERNYPFLVQELAAAVSQHCELVGFLTLSIYIWDSPTHPFSGCTFTALIRDTTGFLILQAQFANILNQIHVSYTRLPKLDEYPKFLDLKAASASPFLAVREIEALSRSPLDKRFIRIQPGMDGGGESYWVVISGGTKWAYGISTGVVLDGRSPLPMESYHLGEILISSYSYLDHLLPSTVGPKPDDDRERAGTVNSTTTRE